MADNNDKKIDILETKKEETIKDVEKKLSPEELKKKEELFLKEFLEKNTKELQVPPLLDEFKKETQRVVSELENSKKEIEVKKQEFINQHKLVEDKLNTLSKDGQITLNEQDLRKTQDSFAQYEAFLDKTLAEVSGDAEFYSNLISENPPKTIKVFKNTTDDPALYLNQKLRSTKKYIKNMIKDVRVSSSRYNVGLQEQIRKLDYLSAYLKAAAQKNKK
jgi:hypothetical protein